MADVHLCSAVQCRRLAFIVGGAVSRCPVRPTLPSFSVAGEQHPRICHQASFRVPPSTGRVAQCSGKRWLDVRRHARYQQFSPSDESAEALENLPGLEDEESEEESSEEDVPEDDRADRVLPESLDGAILQASESAALFVQSGGNRAMRSFGESAWRLAELCGKEDVPVASYSVATVKFGVTTNPMLRKSAAKVELLLPQVANLGEEGDQQKLWNMSRLFLDDLNSRLGSQQLKAIFPDAGVTAMLQFQWKDAPFKFASLNDRKPVTIDDEVVVLVQPDFQMLSNVEKIASSLQGAIDGPPRPLIMYNPALQSGEVGIGLNVRRMREFFLSTFNPVYSMRTLSFGAIFRRYPGPWQVFFDDEKVPGRYLLASEEPARPMLEDVEMLFLNRGRKGGDGVDKEPGPLQNILGAFSSMSRFMQSLSR